MFEEEKKLDFGEDVASMLSSKTTESVASIFQANAEFMEQVEKQKVLKGRFE